MRNVAKVLATEPFLEAVTFDKHQQPTSIAFVGGNDPATLERITERVREAREESAEFPCGLLQGESDCSKCSRPFPTLERGTVRVQREGDSTTISRVTCPTAPRFWHWREIRLPKFGPREVEIHEDHEHEEDEWKPQLVLAVLCGILALSGHFVLGHNVLFGTALFVASYLCGGWFAAKDVFELLHRGKLDVHFLMLAVAGGSATVGAWQEGATLLFLFSISGALEHYAMGRTQREISSLFKSAPKVATIVDANGHEQEIPVEKLKVGMRLLVRPDSQFPVDAEIVKGQSAADESNLTGESIPVEKNVGDNVLAGTLNLWGAVEAIVARPASESALQKIINLIHEAQHLKAPAQRFTDKFGTKYTYSILGLSLLMFFVWWLGLGLPAFGAHDAGKSAFYRSMILLVVASPCALVLSIPSAILAAIAWGARRGVLFRGGAAVEKLAQATVVALDKTGTLTTGELRVERIESVPPGRETEIAQLAFCVERLSTHPLARAIARYAKRQGIAAVDVCDFQSTAGAGLQGKVAARTVFVGKRDWLAQKIGADAVAKLPASEHGFSEVCVATDGLVGRVLLRDDLRSQSQFVLRKLRSAGLKTMVLTGDRRSAGDWLKANIDVDDVRAELKPADKVAAIQNLKREGNLVAMIGDGVNDAPSLAAAHVGVAMGARGSDAALEQAEVVLMNDKLENFWSAYQLSRHARKVIRQNLTISLGTVVILVGFALAGSIPLTLGVVGHEGSTVIVVLNSLRLLFSSDDR